MKKSRFLSLIRSMTPIEARTFALGQIHWDQIAHKNPGGDTLKEHSETKTAQFAVVIAEAAASSVAPAISIPTYPSRARPLLSELGR